MVAHLLRVPRAGVHRVDFHDAVARAQTSQSRRAAFVRVAYLHTAALAHHNYRTDAAILARGRHRHKVGRLFR